MNVCMHAPVCVCVCMCVCVCVCVCVYDRHMKIKEEQQVGGSPHCSCEPRTSWQSVNA